MAVSISELTDESPSRICPSCGAGNLRTSSVCYRCGETIPLHGDNLPAPKGGPLVGDDQITIRVAWGIGVNALRLVRRTRSLLLFPLLGGGSAIGALALLGLAFYSLHPNLATLPFWAVGHLGWVFLFIVLAYLSAVAISTVFLAGLIGASVIALEGGHPQLRDGWRVARAHLGPLLAWSLVDATVGLALQVAARRLGWVGAIVGIAGGIAWGISTYFVVQVLVLEKQRIGPSLARSARIIRYLFGDVVFADIVADLLLAAGSILFIGTVTVGLVGMLLNGYSSGYLLLAAVGVVGGIFLMVLGSAVATVVQTGLFRYAVTGTLDRALFPARMERTSTAV